MNRRVRLGLSVGLVAVVAVLGAVTSPAAVLERVAWAAADPVRFGLVLVALAAVRPLFAWPTTLIAVAAGYGYGLWSVPVALSLIVLTSVPPYLVARRVRSDGRFSTAGSRLVDATGDVRSVTVSRLIPAPSDVVSVGAGVADVSLGAFLLGTALGEIPWAIAGVLAGDSLDTLTTASLAAAVDVRLVVAAALIALGLLTRPAYRAVAESN